MKLKSCTRGDVRQRKSVVQGSCRGNQSGKINVFAGNQTRDHSRHKQACYHFATTTAQVSIQLPNYHEDTFHSFFCRRGLCTLATPVSQWVVLNKTQIFLFISALVKVAKLGNRPKQTHVIKKSSLHSRSRVTLAKNIAQLTRNLHQWWKPHECSLRLTSE